MASLWTNVYTFNVMMCRISSEHDLRVVASRDDAVYLSDMTALICSTVCTGAIGKSKLQ